MAKPLLPDERIVVYPYNTTASAWCYSTPRGKVVRVAHGVATVRLDDGTLRETDVANVRREKGWRPPPPPKFKPVHRPAPPLIEGWDEPPLFEAAHD